MAISFPQIIDIIKYMYWNYIRKSSTRRRKTFGSLDLQRFALIGPFEGFGHRAIVIVDKGEHFGLQVLHTGKGATFENLAHQDAEPDLDLIHPRTMFRGVMKHDPVGRVGEKRGSAGH